jgi:hypothetical protein
MDLRCTLPSAKSSKLVPFAPEYRKFPVFSQLAGEFGFRDGFARDCLLQRRVTCEPDFFDRRARGASRSPHRQQQGKLFYIALIVEDRGVQRPIGGKMIVCCCLTSICSRHLPGAQRSADPVRRPAHGGLEPFAVPTRLSSGQHSLDLTVWPSRVADRASSSLARYRLRAESRPPSTNRRCVFAFARTLSTGRAARGGGAMKAAEKSAGARVARAP